mmetsp:Transcript_4728/g.9763  ORF Transcript_4728/g.9763 Transcript_4728/m.9763 type:complete len:212 (-) Transcript_4728:219-854(-)
MSPEKAQLGSSENGTHLESLDLHACQLQEGGVLVERLVEALGALHPQVVIVEVQVLEAYIALQRLREEPGAPELDAVRHQGEVGQGLVGGQGGCKLEGPVVPKAVVGHVQGLQRGVLLQQPRVDLGAEPARPVALDVEGLQALVLLQGHGEPRAARRAELAVGHAEALELRVLLQGPRELLRASEADLVVRQVQLGQVGVLREACRKLHNS